MISAKDLYDKIANKMAKDIGKSLIRNSFSPNLAEQLCDATDRNDAVKKQSHFN